MDQIYIPSLYKKAAHLLYSMYFSLNNILKLYLQIIEYQLKAHLNALQKRYHLSLFLKTKLKYT